MSGGRWTPYVIRDGDYLDQLAERRGFDAKEVWADRRNDELRAIRKSPNILAPGDIVYLPIERKGSVPIQHEELNRYEASILTVPTTLTFRMPNGEPLADCALQYDGIHGNDLPARTDATGSVTIGVPVTIRRFTVLFPEHDLSYRVAVGGMDPASETTGLAHRLGNLGLCTDPAIFHDPRTRAQWAAAFREQHGLPPGDTIDEAVIEKVESLYGT